MIKKILFTALLLIALVPATSSSAAASTLYTVKAGDTMWKIAASTKVGITEIIKANPQVTNPDWIYPKQQLNIPTANATVSSYEAKVGQLVNAERVKAGLKPLVVNWELSRVARYKSQDMHDMKYFDHNSPVYGSPFTMLTNFGIVYRSAGENIAYGQRTPEEVMTAWMNSSGHRANILNSGFTQIGIGYVADGNYWTQQFISK